MAESKGVRCYAPHGRRASERDLGRLRALIDLFGARGVLVEFKVWFDEQTRRSDYRGGLSGNELVAWVRSAHPELLDDTYRVIRS